MDPLVRKAPCGGLITEPSSCSLCSASWVWSEHSPTQTVIGLRKYDQVKNPTLVKNFSKKLLFLRKLNAALSLLWNSRNKIVTFFVLFNLHCFLLYEKNKNNYKKKIRHFNYFVNLFLLNFYGAFSSQMWVFFFLIFNIFWK